METEKMNKILIFGDICPDNNYRYLFDQKKNGPFDSSVVDLIETAAFSIANLECPATDSTYKIIKTGPNIKALPKDLEVLKNIGINALSMANNHILDYGNMGIEDTLHKIDELNFMRLGAGDNQQEAAKPLIIQVGSQKIGFLAYAEEEFNLATPTEPGANHWDPYISLNEIRELKKECNKVIILYHGGIEHYRYPSPELQKKCRAMIDAGGDIVTCQHSHCIGTNETYKTGYILYGQGNFAFGYREEDPNWNEGLVLEYNVATEKINLILLSADKEGIRISDKNTSCSRLKVMEEESKVCKDFSEIKRRWDKFCDGMKSLDLPLLYGYPRILTKLNRITRNRLIALFKSKKAKMITMELLRCEAHQEVVKTILENEIAWNQKDQKYR